MLFLFPLPLPIKQTRNNLTLTTNSRKLAKSQRSLSVLSSKKFLIWNAFSGYNKNEFGEF